MADHADLIRLARKRGDERLDLAIGLLHKEAAKLAKAAGIPENIGGNSPGNVLGRISYVVSMSRDLRRECSQALSAIELNKITDHTSTLDVREELDEIPPPSLEPLNTGKALEDTKLPLPLIAALKASDLNTIGDVMGIPDEHLLKMRGIGARSLEQIKQAIR